MKRVSDKRLLVIDATAPFRSELKARVAKCEWCGRRDKGLCVHEILRGYGLREQALDKAFAVLVLCDDCHFLMSGRAWAEQLAIMRRSRCEDFNLAAFHNLARRVKPDISEVELWERRMSFGIANWKH